MITFCYFKPPLARDTLLAEIEVPLKEIASKMHMKIFTSETKKKNMSNLIWVFKSFNMEFEMCMRYTAFHQESPRPAVIGN